MDLNQEKKDILKIPGDVLVTANPGTGKTLLLAHKYVTLVQAGVDPKKILCLTFTDKAKAEMERRIIKIISDSGLKFNLSDLNVYTFHSYAFEHIGREDIISSNLLRYAIFRFLKDNEVLNYGDQYLVDTIVPKMENLLRYLKSFGIMPNKIDIQKAKAFLVANEKLGKDEIDKFAEDFVRIFEHYEQIKNGKGADYADLLIEFLAIKTSPVFDVVLVDELQDVNEIEADIALKSGKQFFVVGDKKQAIFGFQGGSILNFRKFGRATSVVLSENFRSTNQILNYAREYMVSRTADESNKKELENLRNPDAEAGEVPVIYEIDRGTVCSAVCGMVQELMRTEGSIAVIARTNYQIMDIAREMKNKGIEFSSTFFTASEEAKDNIIRFLKGVLSRDIQEVKNAMFTPFFPITLQDAFELAEDRDLTLDVLYEKCPEFAKLRQSIKTVEDVNTLFKEKIIPVAVSYGKEYLLAAIKVQEAYQEAMRVLENKTLHSLAIYLESSDLLSDEFNSEKQVTLTTVHKAKGREFDAVIYLPAKTTDRSNFQDEVVEAILKSKGINADEELEEETLRVNFVAFTRAQKRLYILTDKPAEYLNQSSTFGKMEIEDGESYELDENKRRAYNLFVNGEFEKAKELLISNKGWMREFVRSYFSSLDHISFSSLNNDAYEYFVSNILDIRDSSPAATIGGEVHKIAARVVMKEEIGAVSQQLGPYVANVKSLIGQIRKDYPENFSAEEKIVVPLANLVETADDISFMGIIDAVFKNGSQYLIVDWKTDRSNDNSSKHRQQLEAYHRVFAAAHGVPLEKVRVAIGFVGLRGTVNMGRIEAELDTRQPANSAFETFKKKVETVLSWRKDPDFFFDQLIEANMDDALWRSIVEQYNKEKPIMAKSAAGKA